MPDQRFREYSYRDIVQVLLEREGIHEGLWQLQVNLGFGATYLKSRDESEAGDGKLRPAAIVTVNHFALAKVEEESEMSFDARELNPAKRKRPVARKTASKK